MAGNNQDKSDFYYLNSQGYLKVSDIHEIWYGDSENEKGVPVLNLHGGPGAVSRPYHADKFDLKQVRLIQFDQRGSGQSKPTGETEDNTTSDLIEDIEKLRKHLKIEKWIVSGASWGSTLALLYAQAHPDKVLGLAIASVFLGRKEDFEWLGKPGNANQFYPDIWDQTIQPYIEKHQINYDQLNDFASDKITNGTLEEKQETAAAISNWEYNLMTHENNFKITPAEDLEEEDIASTKIYLHYEKNAAFLRPNQILEDVDKIKDIPTAIVHSRFDMVCALNQAYLLKKHFSDLRFEIVNAHGHKFGTDAQLVAKYVYADLINRIKNG